MPKTSLTNKEITLNISIINRSLQEVRQDIQLLANDICRLVEFAKTGDSKYVSQSEMFPPESKTG